MKCAAQPLQKHWRSQDFLQLTFINKGLLLRWLLLPSSLLPSLDPPTSLDRVVSGLQQLDGVSLQTKTKQEHNFVYPIRFY